MLLHTHLKYKRASDIFYLYEYLTLASSSKTPHKILLKLTAPYGAFINFTKRRFMTKVISNKQLEANRANSLKSTGPKSEEGKLRSKGNALKHGLTARKHLIVGDDPIEFEEYRDNLWCELQPKTVLQEEMVMQIITTGWKIRRYQMIETGLFNHEAFKAYEFNSLINFSSNTIYLADFKGKVCKNEPISELQGKALSEDCSRSNAILKLSTLEQRLIARFYKLLEIYEENKSKKKKSVKQN